MIGQPDRSLSVGGGAGWGNRIRVDKLAVMHIL